MFCFLDKVRLEIDSRHQYALPVIKDVWHRLDELECDVDLCAQIDESQYKKFDKLRVRGIANSGKYKICHSHW
jgi:hypothetical protein